jgi:hypothetical protein
VVDEAGELRRLSQNPTWAFSFRTHFCSLVHPSIVRLSPWLAGCSDTRTEQVHKASASNGRLERQNEGKRWKCRFSTGEDQCGRDSRAGRAPGTEQRVLVEGGNGRGTSRAERGRGRSADDFSPPSSTNMKQIYKEEELVVPAGVTVAIKARVITVVGPRGTLLKVSWELRGNDGRGADGAG